jgi:FMN phosphatase YigB (HAD superfamily)
MSAFFYIILIYQIQRIKMKLKAVFFDLDGTLLPMDQDVFIGAYIGGLTKKLAPFGYDPKAVASALWKGTGDMVKNDGSLTNDAVFWNSFAAILGEEVREEEKRLDDFYRNEFQQVKDFCGYNPEAKRIVYRLKERGVTVILATSPFFPAVATESRIRWAGLEPRDFAFITTYENSSYCKPNPDYYRWLLDKFNLSPEECLMVGNDVGDDMVAEELGMRVFLLTDCLINKTERKIEEFNHGSFDELVEYIEEII